MDWQEIARTAPFLTHEVTNQPPPLADLDLFSTDRALGEAVEREGAAWARPALGEFGTRLGRAETRDLGRLANAYPPVLRTFDAGGRRIDEVEFHPAYHALLGMAVGEGLHSAPWAEPRPGAHVARGAGVILMCQVEAGIQCPTTMTYGAVAALRRQEGLAAEWLPRICSRAYDPRAIPAAEKTGAMIGMGMTEKQGGSDLRTNTSRAVPLEGGAPGTAWRIDGHKWFLSAPMCDAFLVLAQTPEGPGCFVLPRFLPDGTKNALHLQRLKDKLGNRSNASGEVEFHGAIGWLLGEPGRGVPTIIEMGTYTRLDCVLGTTGLMRRALVEALHHARHRSAFGRRLAEQPLMLNLLADLALECEAATALGLRMARAFDREDDLAEASFRRLVTPAAKYFVCKRGAGFAAEAMEVLGGIGYVEESVLPRLYREMPVNSIWEGSGNVMCLDLLRAAARTQFALDSVFEELALAKGADRRLDAHGERLGAMVGKGFGEAEARRVGEALVLALQGALLVRFAPAAVADAFCASRLGGDRWGAYGTLPEGLALAEIVERAAYGLR
jgi:putative acyl-CoA dehydrogenase